MGSRSGLVIALLFTLFDSASCNFFIWSCTLKINVIQNVLQVRVVVDDAGCNGNEDINFQFTGFVTFGFFLIQFVFSYEYYWSVILHALDFCFNLPCSSTTLGLQYLVELLELMVERAVHLKMEGLQM